ncbi:MULTISPECIES: TetR/AcrR family transcriptional regulator C-terminal domain-containing protein [Streptomyces]|uniref:TetR/AcrR family transcriptional regulator C-terminal domain-containing protein n=1 Tax=Streptomyces TaxID=1883 RepID=UPI001367AA93|nr:GntR family transcriptional regulator [Streptomyces sp. SID5606]MZD53113.1 GntR family transcriptional regulator [Streptomyces sp. SID5606]
MKASDLVRCCLPCEQRTEHAEDDVPSGQRTEPPYRVIAAEIRSRIVSGELRPGDPVPSIRAIAQRWGVAIATATRASALLRDDGLVEARVGSGTVVSARTGPARSVRSGTGTDGHEAEAFDQELHRRRILRAAVDLADTDGLQALTMRRLAAELGLGPMSLYRYVSGKEELLAQMTDLVFGDLDLPEEGPGGWRARLELVARGQWRLCRRHPWLSRVVSFTRPVLVPHMMATTEWTLRALEGLDLPMDIRLQETLTLHALVVTIALSKADEAQAERNTGMTLDRWSDSQRSRRRELLESGSFPLLSAFTDDTAPDLDLLFEYGLARHLDGFAAFLATRNLDSEPT